MLPRTFHLAELGVVALSQDLGDVISNMNTLNRNLENLVTVGRDVERAGDVVKISKSCP